MCSGTSDAGTDAPTPASCDLTKSLADSPECLADALGIFVSPTGKDGASGTKAEPIRTVVEALEAATRTAKPRVYVCGGVFDARITITQAVAIYGGLTCAWAIDKSVKPTLRPPSGVAVEIKRVAGPVLLEDLAIGGLSNPTIESDSAIAMFVGDSKNVVLRRVTLTAGAAQSASKPIVSGSNYMPGGAKKGRDADGANGGPETTCPCFDGKTSSKGGAGATANSAMTATSGIATPPVGSDNGGLSGTASCSAGADGANGVATKAGVGATASWLVNEEGWLTTAGSAGGTGNPGQGGGGGGSMNTAAVGGAAGGCGGCGGFGGAGGASGGSSIALVSFQSIVSIEDSSLQSGPAGDGAAGGDAEDGETGGLSGVSTCPGSKGGNGAGGAGGGGGAGGHSLAIGYRGVEPRVVGTTMTVGTRGVGGSGGAGGHGLGNAGPDGSAGVDGLAKSSLALPSP